MSFGVNGEIDCINASKEFVYKSKEKDYTLIKMLHQL